MSLRMSILLIVTRAISTSKGVVVYTVFFPLMAILEGGVRFPVDPLNISTLRFYSLCPDQIGRASCRERVSPYV